MKVAILYIGIGQYIDFWRGFYISCEEHFLKGEQKDYFVFTDSEKIYMDEKIHRIYQEDLGWPGNSLMRYTFFMGILEELKQYDYIYFFNGNVLFLEDISIEEFCPVDDALLVIQHHWFVDKPNVTYPYDRNPNSLAYIPMGEGKHYVCGGINGAKAQVFINFIQILYKRIEEDKQNGVVALWHDESHVNRYILDYPNIKLLPPSYCYPELVANPELSFERKIICRDKRKYFNLYKFKEPEQELERLVYDSKRLLEEEHYEKLVQRWLHLKSKGVNLGEYFKEKGITQIAIATHGRLADLFFSELKQKDISVVKIINENYEELYYYGIKCEANKKSYATIITDTFSFSRIYEIMALKGEKNLISLEDIINTLYENYCGGKEELYSAFITEEKKRLVVEERKDPAPICDLPENSRIILYGGGKVGTRFYSILKNSQSVNFILWVDADYKKKQEMGIPVHNIDVIKDTTYDYIILGTSVENIMVSMKDTLEKKGVELEKVIWFNKESQSWEGVQ